MKIKLDFRGAKVLVTGGAGFVGANFIRHISKLRAEVTVLDNLFTGQKKYIENLGNVDFVKGSTTNKKLVESLVMKNDFIVHLAARNIIASTKSPMLDLESNVIGTMNLLIAAKKYKVKKFIYSSSASVYGEQRVLPIIEQSRLKTYSPYAVSKLAAENYCSVFWRLYKVPTISLRLSNVYGPFQNPDNPYSGVIHKFIKLIDTNNAVKIHGDGLQTRDFTFVDDVSRAIKKACFVDGNEGMIFNVGTGVESSIQDIVKNLEKIYNKKIKVKYAENRDIDNVRRRLMNIESIRINLNWIPKTIFRDGLIKTINWHT